MNGLNDRQQTFLMLNWKVNILIPSQERQSLRLHCFEICLYFWSTHDYEANTNQIWLNCANCANTLG